MKKITIIGLGFMGGSLALAIKRKGIADTVYGYARREETRVTALDKGVVDIAVDTLEAAVDDAEFVVFCVPVLSIPGLVDICKPYFSYNTVITDVGSTKAKLVKDITGLLDNIPVSFIGSHPIAGSEKSGLTAARDDLYEGSVVIVTSSGTDSDSALIKVQEFWELLGTKVSVMMPEEHDRIIARTSHLPHLTASALVSSVCREEKDMVGKFCGTGFYDTTRISTGTEEVWHDILKSNSSAVSQELAELSNTINRVKLMIDKGAFEELKHFLAQNRKLRLEMEKQFRKEKIDQ